jgi:hypothetical protein
VSQPQVYLYFYPIITLLRLKKGPRTNIVIGPDNDRYIGLEGASIHLLAHFSPYAKKKLIDERSTVLTILNGSKKAIHWTYKYMQSAESNPQNLEPFADLCTTALIHLYQTSVLLEYTALQHRVFGRLKSKLRTALPSAEEMNIYQTSIPELFDYAIHRLSLEMLHPWTCNYTLYLTLTSTNKTFGDALGNAMQKLLAERIEAIEKYYRTTKNTAVQWAIRYIEDVRDGRPTTTTRKKSVQKKKVRKQPFTCYNCKGEGHFSRDCPIEASPATVLYRRRLAYVCDGEGDLCDMPCRRHSRCAQQ